MQYLMEERLGSESLRPSLLSADTRFTPTQSTAHPDQSDSLAPLAVYQTHHVLRTTGANLASMKCTHKKRSPVEYSTVGKHMVFLTGCFAGQLDVNLKQSSFKS